MLLPSVLLKHKMLLSSFHPPLLLLTSPRHPKEVQPVMFYAERDCTLSFCVWLCLEVPLFVRHILSQGSSRSPPPERNRDPRVSTAPTAPGCSVLGSCFSCSGEERLGLLPDSRLFSWESCRVCLSSPLHPSHTHARSGTLTHTLLLPLMMLLLLPPLLLLRSVAPLPFDGSLTHTHTTTPLRAL